MRKQAVLVGVLLIASCASPPPHHRGGFGGGRMGGMGMDNYQSAPHILRTPGTADADAVLFASFDRDGDLLISSAELEAGIAREFARADANHDGSIDPAEYRTWSLRALGGLYAPFRQDIDRDGDGRVSRDEFAGELRARAQRYDSNGDGVIEHSDLVRGAAASDDDLQMLTPQSGDGSGAGPTGGAGDGGGPRRRR